MTDTVLVGIDEAGLGPILGPLVVSAAVFTIPAGCQAVGLWQKLDRSISAEKKRLAGRLLICDSKKAFSRLKGIAVLEKTVLSSLKILSKTPTNIAGLAKLLCPESLKRLTEYPWYQDYGKRVIKFCADDISISARAFAANMADNGIALADLKSFCFDVAYYNQMVAKVNNKSTVLFYAVCSLIDKAIKASQHKNYHFVIDRQGGRMRHTYQLRKMFPETQLKVLGEDENKSSYLLSTSYKRIKIEFCTKADADYMPVSLASMTSKYLRERLMECINLYFASKCDSLKPTAGYWTDGKRFLNDIKITLPHLKYNPNQLIRCR